MLFKYEERARQLIDYENLSWGVIHPSDIDGCLEFDGYKLCLLEYKTVGKDVDIGQKLLLCRIARNWEKAENGNISLVVVAEHNTQASEIVDGGNAKVREIYYEGRWIPYTGFNRTVKTVVENYVRKDLKRKGVTND